MSENGAWINGVCAYCDIGQIHDAVHEYDENGEFIGYLTMRLDATKNYHHAGRCIINMNPRNQTKQVVV